MSDSVISPNRFSKGISIPIPVLILALILPIGGHFVLQRMTGEEVLNAQLDRQTSDIREIKDNLAQMKKESRTAKEKREQAARERNTRVLLLEINTGVK